MLQVFYTFLRKALLRGIVIYHLIHYFTFSILLASGKDISLSSESLGEEIKLSAQNNKCLQDLEKSNENNSSSVDEPGSKTEEQLNNSYSSSLLARVNKTQEALKDGNSNSSNQQPFFSNIKSPPKNYPPKEEKFFKTPDVIKECCCSGVLILLARAFCVPNNRNDVK